MYIMCVYIYIYTQREREIWCASLRLPKGPNFFVCPSARIHLPGAPHCAA